MSRPSAARRLAGVAINVLLVVASVTGTMYALEWTARTLYYARGGEGLSRKEFRLRRPPPYRQSPYFSEDFIRESLKMPEGWTTPPGTRLIIPADYDGRYTHVKDSLRVTTDPPATWRHTLWVLGGSTIFAVEVPDADTIPSHLQRLVNAATPGTWRVVNAGAITVTSAQQLERLRTLPVAAGDLVVFYDGVNDISQGIFYNRPGGWIVEVNREMAAEQKRRRTFLVFLDEKARAIMPHVFDLLQRAPASDIPAHLLDMARVQELVAASAARHRESELAAAAFARERGAGFAHFLQPNLFTQARPTDYERHLEANRMLVFAGLSTAFAAGLGPFRDNVRELRAQGLDSHDLTGLFDDRPPGEEYFLDHCHVTERANARVAGAIFREIAPRLGGS